MGKFTNLKGKIKTNIKAYRFGLFNFRKLIKFIETAPDESRSMNVPSMNVFELKEKMDKNEIFVLDVRSAGDFESANIDGSVRMELFDIIDNLTELPKDKEIGVICYGGGASKTVTQILLDNDFQNVKNIEGGIIRYALDIDEDLLGRL